MKSLMVIADYDEETGPASYKGCGVFSDPAERRFKTGYFEEDIRLATAHARSIDRRATIHISSSVDDFHMDSDPELQAEIAANPNFYAEN